MDPWPKLIKKDAVSSGDCEMEVGSKLGDVELLDLSVMEYDRRVGLRRREPGHMQLMGGQVRGWGLGVGLDRYNRYDGI